jgi:hypothetical protein
MVKLRSTLARITRGSWGPCLALGVGLALTWSGPGSAQIVRGQVVDSLLGTPIAGGSVALLDDADAEVARTLTDERGLFLLRAPGAGQYRLRAEGEGYRMSVFPPFDLAADGMLAYRLLVPPVDAPPPSTEPDEDDAELLIDQICQGEDVPGLPVMVGLVRDAVTQEAVPQADVILTWSSIPIQLAGFVGPTEDNQGSVTAGNTGFYAVCGVPPDVRIELHAEAGGLTSEFVSLRFQGGGVHAGDEFIRMPSRLWRQDFEVLPRTQRTASVSGTVTDTSGSRVASANVQIVGTSYTVRANLFGEFHITGLPPGHMRVAAELVGYRPVRTEIQLGLGEALQLPDTALRMTPVATELDPVTVEADRPVSTRRDLSEFERRRATTTGSFTTREEFMKIEPQETTDVLRRMRGIRVRAGTGFLMPWIITSSRGARTGDPTMGGECFPIVFIDRQYVGSTGTIVVDNVVPIDEIEAIEFYASVAGLPPEFNRQGSVCGVLVFWTR